MKCVTIRLALTLTLLCSGAAFAQVDPNLVSHPQDTRPDSTLLVLAKNTKNEQRIMKKKLKEAERRAASAKKKQVS